MHWGCFCLFCHLVSFPIMIYPSDVYMSEFMCLCLSTVYKHVCWCADPLPNLTSCPRSSNHAAATVSLELTAPDNQKSHTTETLLVQNTHRQQLPNPPAGSNSLQSVKHKTWRPFTVKHLMLLEIGSARHMLSKWQGLLITQEVRQRRCEAEPLNSLNVCCG